MSNESTSYFEPCEDELDHPFVMVPTAIIRNPDISPEAKWFLSYLLSHTKKWRISIPYIIKSQKISKNRIYPIIDECLKLGYLKRESFLEKGLKKYRYFVSREPKFKEFLRCPQNQDTENQDTENEDRIVYQSSSNEEEKKINKKRVEVSPPSADAESLCDFFLSKMKERNPEFKSFNLQKWRKEFDCLIRIDKRDVTKIREVILWASTHKWWKVGCLSPAKLRQCFDEMTTQMLASEEQNIVRKNRSEALKLKEQYPEQMKAMTFDENYVMNRFSAKEIPFNLPPETFMEGLISLFGGHYVTA